MTNENGNKTKVDINPLQSIAAITVTYKKANGRRTKVQFTTSFKIGRDPKCQIHLDFDLVSRYHTEIFVDDNGWHLRDLGSTNGTHIDGSSIKQVDLNKRMEIQIGGKDISLCLDPVQNRRKPKAGLAESPTEYVKRYLHDRRSDASSVNAQIVRQAFNRTLKQQTKTYRGIIVVTFSLLITAIVAGTYQYFKMEHFFRDISGLSTPAVNNSDTPLAVVDNLRKFISGEYHALIIGNNDYDGLPDLKTAVGDAKAIENILRDQYNYQTRLVLNGTRQLIITELDELRMQLKEDDKLLIYYAGHGYFDKGTERGYWLPTNAGEYSTSEWISNTDITDKVKAIKAKHVVIVADSCYSGTLTRDPGISEGPVKHKVIYYQRMLKKSSRTVLSSGGLEPVIDSGGGEYSVFAKAFMDALQENPSVIDGTQLFNKIRRQVILNAHQTPEYSIIRFAGHDGGDYLFIKGMQ